MSGHRTRLAAGRAARKRQRARADQRRACRPWARLLRVHGRRGAGRAAERGQRSRVTRSVSRHADPLGATPLGL
eukprot:5944824-Pyramimonas_sp.AAC.1